MGKTTTQYANINNGGQERVTRDGNRYYVSSDFGKGFCALVEVSRGEVEACMSYTKAPADVVAAILAA